MVAIKQIRVVHHDEFGKFLMSDNIPLDGEKVMAKDELAEFRAQVAQSIAKSEGVITRVRLVYEEIC